MGKRAKLMAGLMLAGLAGVAGWWALVPKVHTASEAEVRARIAPELLLPMPQPAGGVERYAALREALEPLLKRKPADREAALSYQPAFALDDPDVRRVIDVLQAGPLDRTGIAFERQAPVHTLLNGLMAVALREAELGRWPAVMRQMEAGYLVLDRQAECDASIDDRISTLSLGRRLQQTSLQLALRRDLPVEAAARLAELNARDRNDPQSIRRVLGGETQYGLLKWIPEYTSMATGEQMWVPVGTYDPLETAELFSDMYVEAVRNAALPVSRWSHDAEKGVEPEVPVVRARSESIWHSALQAVWMRLRMNTGANSLGRQMAALIPIEFVLMRPVLRARTTQDQVGAALAVARFRHRFGRDPGSFEELINAGYLQVAPRDQRTDQPLAFDLQKLFEWPPGNSL